MAVGFERRARKAASRLHQALLLHPASKAMSNAPLSLTSGVSLALAENQSFQTSAEPLDLEPNIPGAPSLQQQPTKKRRSSKGKIPVEIRRSSSTPHMRNLALTTSGELSPTADKRRNKLGYHRTSVACGHCRRRKIRCLISNDDPSGRCANCIRLKKECNFYPVEQTPENQRAQSALVKEGVSGVPASSTTSSPRHPPSSGDKIDEFRPPTFSNSASHPPTSRFGVQPEVDVDPHQTSQSGGIPMQHPPYAFPPPIETQWPTPGFLPPSSVADTSPASSEYWRPSPSAPNSAYGSESNVSANQTPTTVSSASNMSFGRPSDGHSWMQPGIPPPTRSMSYGNIEGLPHQYGHSGLGIQQHDYPRRASPYVYPTTIDTTSSIHSTTLGSTTSAPLSAPILPNQQYAYPPVWNQFGGVPSPAHDLQGRSMSAQWYNEPGRLDRVQEENGANVVYSQNSMPHFYSGS